VTSMPTRSLGPTRDRRGQPSRTSWSNMVSLLIVVIVTAIVFDFIAFGVMLGLTLVFGAN